MGRPASERRTLWGRRVDARRAGMTAKVLVWVIREIGACDRVAQKALWFDLSS